MILNELDDSFINIQPYLFTDLPVCKVLITTRHMDLASHIKNAHILHVGSLHGQMACDFLDIYIASAPSSAIEREANQKELVAEEKDARKRII